MNKQQQLKAYKKALFHYILTWIFPFLSYDFGTDSGFCAYFSQQHISFSNLDKLQLQKPKGVDNTMFWFKYGSKLPRIKCLWEAVKLCK